MRGEFLDPKKMLFQATVDTIRQKGYEFHRAEHDADGRDPKIYHVSEHPRTVERRAEKMADIFNLSSEQRGVMKMAIARHDTIMEYDPADENDLLAMIHRHRRARETDKTMRTEGNEKGSARLLEEEMRKANEDADQEIFTEEHIKTGIWAIHATYTDRDQEAVFEQYPYYSIIIEQNPVLGRLLDDLKTQEIKKGPLFFQPHLEKPLEDGKPVPREVLVVALSDLGAAGCADKEEFFKEGDDEMRELYGNLRKPEIFSRLAEGNTEQDREDREKVMNAFIAWLEGQIGFVVWQALRFEKIIHLLKKQNGINEEEEQGLRAFFCHYEENIRATQDRAIRLKKEVEDKKSQDGEKLAFLYLARSMGYGV